MNSLEIVNPASYNSLTNALTSGNFTDFENIHVGNPGGTNFNAQLNRPQTALAFDLEGLDSSYGAKNQRDEPKASVNLRCCILSLTEEGMGGAKS
jgi:hypothetical protein